MKLAIELNKSVGPFELGAAIDEYLAVYTTTFIPGEAGESWDGYYLGDDQVEIYVDKETRSVYDFKTINLQLWADESGRIVTVFAFL